ncbi:MAG: hypothetical protein Q9172_005436 [Xanthocarpia lactea]
MDGRPSMPSSLSYHERVDMVRRFKTTRMTSLNYTQPHVFGRGLKEFNMDKARLARAFELLNEYYWEVKVAHESGDGMDLIAEIAGLKSVGPGNTLTFEDDDLDVEHESWDLSGERHAGGTDEMRS